MVSGFNKTLYLSGLFISCGTLADIEQWRAEIEDFNECLHYAIVKLELNVFNIILSVRLVNISIPLCGQHCFLFYTHIFYI